MRFLSKKQVKERIGLSFAHLARLETEPAYAHLGFPRRVHIGFRVFWLEEEIDDFMLRRLAARDIHTGS